MEEPGQWCNLSTTTPFLLHPDLCSRISDTLLSNQGFRMLSSLSTAFIVHSESPNTDIQPGISTIPGKTADTNLDTINRPHISDLGISLCRSYSGFASQQSDRVSQTILRYLTELVSYIYYSAIGRITTVPEHHEVWRSHNIRWFY